MSRWGATKSDLLYKKYYICVWSIGLQGRRSSSAKIIFANPETDTLFYYTRVKI